jgi:ribonuclease R
MAGLPSKSDLLGWIRENPGQVSKRDIARAFGVKGADRPELKRLLRELAEEGHLEKDRRAWREAGRLPPVGVLEVLDPGPDGDLYARPLDWAGDGPAPRALYIPRKGEPALAPGDSARGRRRAHRADLQGRRREWQVRAADSPWRADGELVEAEQAGPKGPHGPAAGAHRRAAGRSRRAEGRQPDRDP